jgi:hypothetical protein
MRTSNPTINIKFQEEIFPSRFAITAKKKMAVLEYAAPRVWH